MKHHRQFLILVLFLSLPAIALGAGPETAAPSGMTLWDILRSGGVVIIVLGLVSLIMTALVLYLLLRLQEKRVAPLELLEKILPALRERHFAQARKACAANDSLLAGIVYSGLAQDSPESAATREAVEKAARREATNLWTSLGYVSDIAQIAPMLGLLGTVLGMIQAFNTIAFDTGIVKPIALAGGVAKAMITTAGGLTIAIIATAFYSALRTRIQYSIHSLEGAVSRVLEALPHD